MQRTILVVDDIATNRLILKRMLSDEYNILEAKDGKEALAVLRRSYKFLSAVLLDLSMPEMDGYDVLMQISVNPVLSQIPVIVATSSTDDEAEMKALTLGAQDFISKPYKPGIIKRRLGNIIKLRETAATVNTLQRDKLTGLLTRENFFQKAADLIKLHTPGYYVLSCLDIDNFKVINDQYGSAKGDHVLKFVAACFKRGLDNCGGLACRITADNFAVLYPRSLTDTGEMERLRREASALDGSIPPITISTGRYIVDNTSLPVSAMYDRAALAEATVKGRFDVTIAVYDESMREKLLREQAIVNEMRQALMTGQFEAWYQPQYNHSTGALIGAEALVRWRHPERGLIPPSEFIPVFENNGFIYELDKYVWEQVCASLRRWLDEGRTPLPVSVNISRYDLFKADLLDTLLRLLEKYKIPVELLRLEITESAFSKSTQQLVNVVKRMIAKGFTVEIDDFGSGYSSLNTLKDVPAQIVKLDMRFFEGGDDSGRGGNIIESVVRMTKWLGMSVIAEGVELIQQADYLKSIGCNYIQGYLYARPIPTQEYEALAHGIVKEEKLIALETVENLDNSSFWDPESMDTLIFNSYVGGACIFEFSGGRIELLRATDRYVRMLGSKTMTVQDAISLDWNSHVDEENQQKITDAIRLSRQTKDDVTEEYTFLGLPGCAEKTYLRSTLRVIATAGERCLVYCTNENIAKQREAERDNAALLQQLSAIMTNMNGGVAAVTVGDGDVVDFVFANDRYYSILGYTKEQYKAEISGAFEPIVREDRARIIKAVEDVIKSGGTASLEYRCIRRDGNVVYVRCNATITNLTGVGAPVLLSVITDITDSVLARRKERETDEIMQAILLNVVSGIAATTIQDGQMRYLFANRQYSAMFGYTPEQFKRELSNGIVSLIDPRDRDRAEAVAMSNEGAHAVSTAEFRARRRDGRVIWVRSKDSVCRIAGVSAPVHIAVLYDITGEKETLERISSLNENLKDLMNDTPGGFARLKVQPDGALATVYVNEPLCQLRGMTNEQILAEDSGDSMDTVHPDDRQLVRETVRQMIETRETRRVQYRLRRFDGSYIPLNVFGRFSKNEAGEGFLNVYYADMNQQEKREMSVRETLPFLLNAILDNTSELAFAKDKNFVYLCCSPAFARFAGRESPAEVVGKTDMDLFAPEVAERFRADDTRLFATGKSLVDAVEPIHSADGQLRYSRTSKYILRDTTGSIIGLYGSGRDVTEERTAFEQLKLLTDSISGGLLTYATSPKGIRLKYFNDGICRMLGCTRREYEEATRESVITSVFEEDVPMLQAEIQKMIRDGRPINCVYRLRNIRGGGYKWVNLRVAAAERMGEERVANAVLYDITEQKNAEQAAAIHVEEMKLAMSRMDKMLCEYDIPTRTLLMPEVYAKRFGVPALVADVPDVVLRRNDIDEEYRQEYANFYAAIHRGEKTGSAEYREKWADGTYHWERVQFSTIMDGSGQPTKTLIAVEDTTQEHRQYELERNRIALGEANLLVHALFNLTTGETLQYAYRDGTEVPMADRTAYIYGEDTIARLIPDPEAQARYRQLNDPDALIARFRRGEKETAFEYRRRLPDGRIVWTRNVLRLVRDPGCDDILLFEYFYDIDEEKNDELMFTSIVTTGYDYVARLSGRDRNYFIVSGSDTAYGLPPKRGSDTDEAALFMARIAHPDDRAMVEENTLLSGIRRNLEHRERFQFVYREIQADQSVRLKRMTEYYLDREMELIVVTREDVTQFMREEAEKSEALTDALAAANLASQAKSTFLSRMSHELRTPMNAIIGLSALSAAELDDRKAMENNIGKIGISARYLLSLINDILEMSRIESGRMTLNEEPFDFEEFISGINTIIYGQASAKGLDYDVVVRSYTEPDYVGDVTKLQEILVNVLSNAVKFTPAGGKVTMTIEQLRRSKSHASMRFTVSDTGIGIDESFLPHLFDAFSQESSSFASTSNGTGLGLAITKNLAEMMNGQIHVKSIKGIGSVFTIDLQLGISQTSRQYLDMVSSMKLDNLSALVVDDDVTVCESTGNILKAMGMKAEWVDSGPRAVSRVEAAHGEKKDFDTIFIDWKMPDMDGIETTRQIRKIVGPEVTIVIMTAYDWRAIEQEAVEAGVDMFMEKPLFQSSIVKAFERVFITHQKKLAPPQPERPNFAGKRFLLAEDHPLNVEVAKRLLERVGAQVVVAGNGLEALELFTTSEDDYFDAILMDICMPEMDGLTSAKAIRKLRKARSREIPIIAMTANAFDEDVELSLKSGMNAHLTKPIDPELMYSTIKRLIER